MGDCRLTRAECDEARTKFLVPVKSDGGPCGALLNQRECDDIQRRVSVDLAGRVKEIKQCEYRERVACFRFKNVLGGFDSRACTPGIGMCKERRKATTKLMADDMRVLSDCYVEN